MQFDRILMRRLLGKSMFVLNLFNERSKGSTDYGDAALKSIYDDLIPHNTIVTELYQEIVDSVKPEHKIQTTLGTTRIELLIKTLGWRGFIDSLALYAKNRQAICKLIGLSKAADTWGKVDELATRLPKNPQF